MPGRLIEKDIYIMAYQYASERWKDAVLIYKHKGEELYWYDIVNEMYKMLKERGYIDE